MEDIIKTVESIEDSGNETIRNEAKEQKGDFLVCY